MSKLTRWVSAAFRPHGTFVRIPMPPDGIRLDDTSVLQQRGWRRVGTEYTGPFATPFGTWHGRIEVAGDIFRCFIKDPPMRVVRHHPKSACFSKFGGQGWWSMNIAVNPIDRDPSAVVLYVERVLIESHRLAAGR